MDDMKNRMFAMALAALMLLEGGTMSAQAESGDGYPVFNFDSKTVTLNSGYEMPMLSA